MKANAARQENVRSRRVVSRLLGESTAETHRRLGRLGVHPDAVPGNARLPEVDFFRPEEGETAVSRSDLVERYADCPEGARVYMAFLPATMLPEPRITDRDTFPWSEFRAKEGGFPAVKVRRDRGGKITIADGKHRVEWWVRRGGKLCDFIPAWVIDEKPVP